MIAVVDYGMGNHGSILNMLKRIGAPAVATADPAAIAAADGLILPGVGHFDHGMREIHARGLRGVLDRRVLEDRVPVLGICLGMQLLTRRSEEGTEPGLGWVDAETVRFRFDPKATGLKIPHMGWNDAEPQPAALGAGGLFCGLEAEARFYFVHGYHVVCGPGTDVLALAHHGYDFPAAIRQGHVLGTQFHPEKSHRFGLQLLANFAHAATTLSQAETTAAALLQPST